MFKSNWILLPSIDSPNSALSIAIYVTWSWLNPLKAVSEKPPLSEVIPLNWFFSVSVIGNPNVWNKFVFVEPVPIIVLSIVSWVNPLVIILIPSNVVNSLTLVEPNSTSLNLFSASLLYKLLLIFVFGVVLLFNAPNGPINPAEAGTSPVVSDSLA